MSNSPHPSRPSRSLVGRVAIVTGAGAAGDGIGNGRAISMLLAEDGTSVVCADMDIALAQRTVDMITQEGRGKATAVQADVSVEADCKALVAAALATYGRLDILVNNVGIMGTKGDALATETAEWARGFEVNVTSMVLMAKYSIEAMLKNDETEREGGVSSPQRGSIVNMGSVAGLQGGTPSLFYPTSKGAVVNMTRAMAAHHAKDGIRVNCVCPGMLYTPMMYNAGGGMTDEMRDARRNRSLLKTEGNAWDCACSVRFLASDEARWITGTILTVDAGATCTTEITM